MNQGQSPGPEKEHPVSDYTPPLADIKFVMEDVAGLGDIAASERFAGADPQTVEGILAEAGRFLADVVAPTNRDGDNIGSNWQPGGKVVVPPSFEVAYAKWVESGFGAMSFDPDFGGGGLPWIVSIAVQEMLTSANMGFSLCPLLTQGAIEAIHAHGSDEQKAMYLPKMLTGEWTGTMNLTEPQAGSDVGAVTSKAEPAEDVAPGAWRISGQKIYITWGEHDLASNIVHLVLARTPGSGPGTKGISMFLVPKYFVNPDGSLGKKNSLQCLSTEHKMGIHGSPTCVMLYEDAIGWLVGGENEGMRNMFTMMNNARLSVGLQGLALSERAYQLALQYSLDRQQGRAVGAPAGVSSPIVEHPDVRRMLMTQRAWIDAMRCLIYTNAAAIDLGHAATSAADRDAAKKWQELTDLLIPLSKSLSTDVGCEMTSLAVQIHGGMGFIEETGAAQHYRDIRIAPIYEGTNGIQAADLVGRKLAMRGGAVITDLLDEFDTRAAALAKVEGCSQYAEHLAQASATARRATAHLGEVATSDPRTLLSASTPYLRLLGTTVCAGLLAKAVLAAAGRPDEFHQAKIASARFFGEQILPTVSGLVPAIFASATPLYELSPAQLASR